jgi:hypothetical protein
MGLARQQRQSFQTAEIISFIGEREIASVLRAIDPFGLDDLCTLSPTGQHQAIGSCGDVVCCHCSRVFWS